MNDLEFDPNFDYRGFGVRLREAMEPEKPTAFATRADVPQNTVSKYVRGDGKAGPRLDIVAKMADALGCSIDWLVWGRGDGPDSDGLFVRVPRYDATLAAGAGSWNDGRRRLDDMPFTSAFLRKRLNRSSAAGLAVLEARGDSMEPGIRDGALLLIDENDQRLIDGISAFGLARHPRGKRFRRLTGRTTLISDNAAYPAETVENGDMDKLQIIGRVLWVGQLL